MVAKNRENFFYAGCPSWGAKRGSLDFHLFTHHSVAAENRENVLCSSFKQLVVLAGDRTGGSFDIHLFPHLSKYR
jgi:hypothetical protein